jgi:hypothetical protein
MKTRRDKIDFLNGLTKGTRSAKELLPKSFVWKSFDEGIMYFINDDQVDRETFLKAFETHVASERIIGRDVSIKFGYLNDDEKYKAYEISGF